MNRRAGQRAAGFVSVLVVLLTMGALYLGYGRLQRLIGEQDSSTTALDTSRDAACRANRQLVERAIVMWSVDHPGEQPTFSDLEASGVRVPTCPAHGRYEIVGRQVRCSQHP